MEGILEIDSKPAAEVLKKYRLTGMDLVRLCGISVRIAYQIANGKPIKSPVTLHKMVIGLRNAGYAVTYEEIAGIPTTS